MKIYTKTGDSGQTGLLGGDRVSKDHDRIEAYGSVDELNAVLGVALATTEQTSTQTILTDIQNDLFCIGAQLATPQANANQSLLAESRINDLEDSIDRLENLLPPLKQFILPGGTASAAQLQVARAVCRRAERRVVTLQQQLDDDATLLVIRYLNRLSDLLFVMARSENQHSGVADRPWTAPS